MIRGTRCLFLHVPPESLRVYCLLSCIGSLSLSLSGFPETLLRLSATADNQPCFARQDVGQMRRTAEGAIFVFRGNRLLPRTLEGCSCSPAELRNRLDDARAGSFSCPISNDSFSLSGRRSIVMSVKRLEGTRRMCVETCRFAKLNLFI